MKLTVLGSGTGILHPTRGSAGFWLETGAGIIMLDCSASAIWRAAHYQLAWPDLDAIWISHFHLDHVGGIAPLLAGTKHARQMKQRKKPLTIYGPAGSKKLIDSFDGVNNYKIYEQPFPLTVVEIEELEEFEILPGIKAVAKSTPHTEESMAIHIREGEKRFVYTSDTGFSETLSAFAANVDLLLMECSYFKEKPVEKHLELAEAMHIIRRAAPKRSVLTHFYPEWDDVDFEKEVTRSSEMFEVIQSSDGSVYEI